MAKKNKDPERKPDKQLETDMKEKIYWQHRVLRAEHVEDSIDEDELDKIGYEGWELVAVEFRDGRIATAVFKREEVRYTD